MSHLNLIGQLNLPQWQRPRDWLPLPVSREDQRRSLVALVAVGPRPVSLGFIVRGVAYTVDWGDGVVEQYADGVHATHVYQFARLPAKTYTTRGYRQAVVRVYWASLAETGGAAATSLEVTDYTAVGDLNPTTTPLLDIQLAGRSLTWLVLSPANKPSRMCEQVWLRPLADGVQQFNSYAQGLFENMNALQSVPEFDLGTLTNLDRTFRNCTSLQTLPVFDETLVQSMEEIFSGCTALLAVGLRLSACQSLRSAFEGCTALKVVVLEGAGQVQNWQDCFRDCSSLVDPYIDSFAGALDLSGIFRSCVSLTQSPAITAPLCRTMETAFLGCAILAQVQPIVAPVCENIAHLFDSCWCVVEFPTLQFGKLTNVANAFSQMYALRSPPQGLDTSRCLYFGGMFYNCSLLQTAPELDTSAGVIYGQMFNGCQSLQVVPAYDLSDPNTPALLQNAFAQLYSCQRFHAFGSQQTLDLSDTQLNADAVNEVIQNLGVALNRVLLLTNTPAALEPQNIDIAQAVAKGWMVAF